MSKSDNIPVEIFCGWGRGLGVGGWGNSDNVRVEIFCGWGGEEMGGQLNSCRAALCILQHH